LLDDVARGGSGGGKTKKPTFFIGEMADTAGFEVEAGPGSLLVKRYPSLAMVWSTVWLSVHGRNGAGINGFGLLLIIEWEQGFSEETVPALSEGFATQSASDNEPEW
jgi:hypothetical protein